MLQELKQIWYTNTVPPVKQLIPVPELPAEQELQLWRKNLFARLKTRAANGETRFDLVYATITHYVDTNRYPCVDFSDSMCAIFSTISATHMFCDVPPTTKSTCRGCETRVPTSACMPRRDFEESLALDDNSDFSFYIPTCRDSACVTKAKVQATTKMFERMRELGYRSEPAVMVGDEYALVSIYCPPQLAKWKVNWCNTDCGYNMSTEAQESFAVLHVGTVLQNYLRALLGPELEACATFSRVRPAGPKDGRDVSHYVDYGLFLDWSDDASGESAGKKSKTSE
jgi:hypothetical protein